MLWGWGQVDTFKSMVVRGYATKVLGMNEYVHDFLWVAISSDTTTLDPMNHLNPT